MKTEFKDLQEQRVYIRNLVSRKYKETPVCAKCGKEENVSIVHNKANPYSISFICKNCRVGISQEELANLKKINLLECLDLNERYSHSKNLVLNDKMKDIVEGSLSTDKPLMTYLKEHDLSWNKFNKAISLYEKEMNTKIKDNINKHFKSLRNDKIKTSKKTKRK